MKSRFICTVKLFLLSTDHGHESRTYFFSPGEKFSEYVHIYEKRPPTEGRGKRSAQLPKCSLYPLALRNLQEKVCAALFSARAERLKDSSNPRLPRQHRDSRLSCIPALLLSTRSVQGDSMKLARLRICNFRSFRPQAKEIAQDDVTFLLGPNGAGKTTVLQALARMFSLELNPWSWARPSPGTCLFTLRVTVGQGI